MIYLMNDGTSVCLDGSDFVEVPESKYDIMYKTLNECNKTYSHIKFLLEETHGTVVAKSDDVIQLESCGEETVQLLYRMATAIEDAYPKLMKAIWA